MKERALARETQNILLQTLRVSADKATIVSSDQIALSSYLSCNLELSMEVKIEEDKTNPRIASVLLSSDEAELFITFRQFQDIFITMLRAGVFDTKSGEVTLSFNPDKVLTDIVVKRIAFRR